jgi:hypothetical protein
MSVMKRLGRMFKNTIKYVQARHALSAFVERTIAVADYDDDIMFQVDVLRDCLTREQGRDSPNSFQ